MVSWVARGNQKAPRVRSASIVWGLTQLVLGPGDALAIAYDVHHVLLAQLVDVLQRPGRLHIADLLPDVAPRNV